MRSPALTLIAVAFFVLCLMLCPTHTVGAQSQSQSVVQAPMAQVAREYAWRPARADILPQAQGVKAGNPVPVKIVLLDANGKLTNAIEKISLIVEATGPSRKTESVNVEIAPGASGADLTLPAIATPGLIKLTVRQPENRILESSNFVLITPAQAQRSKSSRKARKRTPMPKPSGRSYSPFAGGARLQRADLTF